MKSKLFVVLTLLVGALLVTGCTTTTASVDYVSSGVFGEATLMPVKDFTPVGLVFTQTELITTRDDANSSVEGEGMTYQALLQEAKKLNAHAIINVAIDKKTMTAGTTTKAFGALTMNEDTVETITFYGSALAINYTGTVRNSTTATTGSTTITQENTPLNDNRSPLSSGGSASLVAEPTGIAGFFNNLFGPK